MSTQTGIWEYLASCTDNRTLHEYLVLSANQTVLGFLSANPELTSELQLKVLPRLRPDTAVWRLNRPLSDEMVKAFYSSGEPLVQQALLELAAAKGYISAEAFKYLLRQEWMNGYLASYILYELPLPDYLKKIATSSLTDSNPFSAVYTTSRGTRKTRSLEIQRINTTMRKYAEQKARRLLDDPEVNSGRGKDVGLSVALATTVLTPVEISMGGAVRAVTSFLGERSTEFWHLFVELAESWAGSYQELVDSALATSIQ